MSEVAYQNKDIMSKIFGEKLKEKSFSVYGIPMSKVKEVLPVNLPEIEANEMATDNFFRLEDDSYALVDYESRFTEKSKIKYVNHIARILRRYGSDIRLRMIVLCTSGVRRINAVLDVGCLRLIVETGYLSSIDAEGVLTIVRTKVKNNEKLSDTETMQLIILPLTEGQKEKQKMILEEVVDLAKNIEDEEQQLFVLSGIITFSDKIMEHGYAKQLEEWIRMTKVGRLFEEEKQRAVAAAVREVEKEKERVEQEKARVEQEKAQIEQEKAQIEQEKARAEQKTEQAEQKTARVVQEKKQDTLKIISLKLLLKGSSVQEASKTTGLTQEEIEDLLT